VVIKGKLLLPCREDSATNRYSSLRPAQASCGANKQPADVLPGSLTSCYVLLLPCPCQDVAVPIAEATPGANRFRVDTASTLQCSVGPNLPNNQLTIRKTPLAIIVSEVGFASLACCFYITASTKPLNGLIISTALHHLACPLQYTPVPPQPSFSSDKHDS
jgi:hypothetical protein